MADEPLVSGPRPRTRRLRRFVLILLAVVALAVLGVWTQRKPIARDFIDDELERRGVPARYEVTRIGLRTQRLENVSIGDPARPDLTADWAEVDIVAGFRGARVRAIRAGGVRLRGRLVDGVVRFGAVDKLLPPPSGKPFTLPNLVVAVDDARMRLDTEFGAIGFSIDGKGNLANGFEGRLAAAAPRNLDFGDCTVFAPTAVLDIKIRSRAPHVEGPARAQRLLCPEERIAVTDPVLLLDATLSEAFDRWRGNAGLRSAAAVMGESGLGAVNARVSFRGSVDRTEGQAAVAAQAYRAVGVTGSRLRLVADYAVGDGEGGAAARVNGELSVGRSGLDAATMRTIAGYAETGAGTPVQPIAATLAGAALRAGRAFNGATRFAFATAGQGASLRLSGLRAESASGARLLLTGGDGVAVDWPLGLVRVDGSLSLAGGGFPSSVVELTQSTPGSPMSGVARIGAIQSEGARLELAPVRFEGAGAGRTRFATRLMLSGPLGDGRVDGLTLPVIGLIGDGVALNAGCAPLAWRRLAIAGLELRPAALRLCPAEGGALLAVEGGRVSGGARIDAPRLAGTLGGTPLSLAASGARVGFTDAGFRVAGLQARLGEADSVTRLDFAELTGRIGRGGGVQGGYAGGDGQIANVPLLISEADGRWALEGGVLTMAGGLRVADAAEDDRFQPLVARDYAFRLADNRIAAAATLREPASGAAVTNVRIAHNLSTGVGSADLDVPGITFNQGLQPEAITRLALGVVANVEGTVTGGGTIRWNPEGVASEGVLRTTGMDLAAAFGPVTGLSTELRFTDLLGLVTAPGQVATVESINPGLLVEDGTIRYQLLPEQRVGIEGGRWPFAGGELILDPTIINFGTEQPRRLTFRVEGLQAAVFIQRLEFENLAATGTFDGTIPMIFDQGGGRIEGGALAARPPGGTLAYVGEVSNADLGIWGDIAFDALKSIAYENLTISLNGDIDGEMVSDVRFNGVSRGTIEPVATGLIAALGGQIAREIQQIPFIFNINIRAPFRQLINTARSFSDPALLIRETLPPELQDELETDSPVQPQESETVP